MPRIAIVQSGTVLFDTPATLKRMAELCRESAARGAQLAVFPESYIGGYPKGLDFGAVLGIRTPEGRELFRRYFDSAIAVPGPETAMIAELARETGLHIVTGVVEKEGGTLYCSALFFSPEEGLTGKHRKIMPTALERVIWGSGDGSSLPVLDTPLGKLGAVICWENYMPLLRTHMYAQGIQLYCAPTVDDRETWLPTIRHIAREGRCFVLSACQYLSRGHYPADILAETRHLPETPIRGGSALIGPLGEVLAGPQYDSETILITDIDLNDITRGKYDLDVTGHYARPDIFTLHVNTAPGTA